MVCFDLGGVVVRICRSWGEACKAAGIDDRLDGELTPEQADAIAHASLHHQTGRMSVEQYAQECCLTFEHRYTPEEVAAVHHAWLQEEYDGVEGIVRSLVGSELELAILSNTNESHWQRLLSYPSIALIPHRIASHEIGLHKPDPAIYRAIEQRLGCEPNTILYFDDLEPNVDAAVSCGWRAERIDPHQPTAPQIRRHLQRYGVETSKRPNV